MRLKYAAIVSIGFTAKCNVYRVMLYENLNNEFITTSTKELTPPKFIRLMYAATVSSGIQLIVIFTESC